MIGINQPRAERATPAGMKPIDQCVQLQNQISDLSKRDAVQVVHDQFPHLSRSWITRNFRYITGLSADALAIVIGHSDPTGEHATNRVMFGGGTK